jgi:hypothetical protein
VLSWYEPSQHIIRFRLITCLVVTVCIGVTLVAVFTAGAAPFAAGYALATRFGPLSGFVEEVASWLYVLSLAATFTCYIRFHRRRMARIRTNAPKEPSDVRLVRLLTAVCVAASFLAGLAMPGEAYQSFSPAFVPLLFLLQAFEPTGIDFPGGDLLGALGRHRQAQYDLRWARMELERCEGLYAGREAGPELRAARAEMERLLDEEARAVADLDAMSYHSRFQP